MSLKNFILSKVFVKNLGLAVAIVVGTVMLLLIWLNFYTRHGQARPVPDFNGLTMEQTSKLARKSRLKYSVIDSVYTNAVPAGCVVEQNPKPGFKVKKWRNIVLTINAFSPEMVAMPNLVDLPKRQALSLLSRAQGSRQVSLNTGLIFLLTWLLVSNITAALLHRVILSRKVL
jgi:beta-lactam-binding protein with PASTA domain